MSEQREAVILVHVNFANDQISEDLQEFQELSVSAGAEIACLVTCSRSIPDAKYFIGSGKAEEIAALVAQQQVGLVIFNHVLSPAQERNLERLIKCRIIDRTGLILDIFAQRARSFEGKLQVELAQLKYQATRLVRIWTHLERQRGGIGLRGPGETQIETDRRLIKQKIKTISARLVKLKQQRELSRRARKKAVVPTIAFVGYTNAGKSTLFNHLSGAMVYAADQLFATLDPTLRRIELPKVGPVIIADTVGFIRHLPHTLIEAFHATLEEVKEADLLLHVIDAADPNRRLHIEQVEHVLTAIGAHKVPLLKVFNKIDKIGEMAPGIIRGDNDVPSRVNISAQANLGITQLAEAIGELLNSRFEQAEIYLAPHEGRLRAELYAKQAVLGEVTDNLGYSRLTVQMPSSELLKIKQR